jgi:hypothetical protein
MKKLWMIPALLLVISGLVVAGSVFTAFDRLVRAGHTSGVKLCYKDADGPDNDPLTTEDNWQCEKNKMYGGQGKYLQGQVRTETVNHGKYEALIRVGGLKPGMDYQVKLNSYGVTMADELANACPEGANVGFPWQCGYWGTEGFLVLGTYTANKAGQIHPKVSYPLPRGIYETKFLIAENQAPWTTPMMETEAVQFIVI